MIARSIIITFFSFASALTFSQNNSDNGNASVPYFESCVGNIPITAAACDGTVVCQIDYPDGTFRQFDNGDFVPFNTPGDIEIEITIGTIIDHLQIKIYPDTPPTFEMYACDGYQVSLDITDTTFPNYLLDYNDGSAAIVTTTGTQPVHQYPAPNPRPSQQISLRANYFDCPVTAQTMNVDDPGARNITQLTVTDNNEIILDFQQGTQFDNVLFQLTNNGSAVIPFQKIHNIDQLIIPGLNPDNQFYCFTLNTANPCPGNPVLPGNTLCSSTFSVTPQLSNRMDLAWQTSSMGSLQTFSIQKNPGNPVPVQGPAIRQYADLDVECPQSYTYRLVSNYPSGISLSKTRTAAAISSIPPPAINTVSTIVQGNSVELQWLQPGGFTPTEYVVSKPSALNVIGTTASPAFTDPEFDPLTNLCYQIRYSDACGNASAVGVPICPLNLTGHLDTAPGPGINDAILEWSAYTGWNGAANVDHYTIERYNEGGTLISFTDVGPNVFNFRDPESASAEQVIIYRISAHPLDPLLVPSVSDEVQIIRSNRIAFPTAFVPGSSISDNATFKAIAREEYNASFELQVYNRWGELLFITNDINEGWDGTYRGNKMPEGTYVFIARFVDQAGRTLKHSGNVVLLRK
jgi:gliding motility-associated-like protein